MTGEEQDCEARRLRMLAMDLGLHAPPGGGRDPDEVHRWIVASVRDRNAERLTEQRGRDEVVRDVEAVLPPCDYDLSCCIETGHEPAMCAPCRTRRRIRRAVLARHTGADQ